VCGVSIELVVEDGTDRAVGERADLDGTPRRTKLSAGRIEAAA
jgi:hypothetical protein